MGSARRNLACGLIVAGFVINSPQCEPERRDSVQQARAYLERGRCEEERLWARRALREGDHGVLVHLALASAQLGMSRGDEALLTLVGALRYEPEDERLHGMLREVCQVDSSYAAARPLLADLLADDPGAPRLQATLGWVLVALGDGAEGEPLLAEAARAAVEPFPALQLSRLYLQSGRPALSLEVVEQALRTPLEPGRLLEALGETYLRLAQVEAADSAFAAAIGRSASPDLAAARIAMTCYGEGRPRLAVDYYERSLALAAGDLLTLNNLAWIYTEQGLRLDRALDLATRAVKGDPDNVVYLDTYAEVQFRLGRPERAAALARRALDVEPEAGEHRAYLQEQLARFESLP